MTQRIIREKLARFLDYKSEQWCKEISEQNLLPETILAKQEEIRIQAKHLKDYLISGGKCFALSAVKGAFSATGYGNWWKTILFHVANWTPNNLESLNEIIELNHLLPPHHLAPLQTLTLGNLLELVLNHVATEQANPKPSIKSFLPEEITQLHYFDPNKNFFEIVINGELFQAKSRDIIGGYFTRATFASLLRDHQEQFPGNICLVHAENHVINVQYEEEKWIIYNSNYSHESIETMTKSFDTAEACVEEIQLCLKSEALALELASFRANKPVEFDFFDKLTTQHIVKLIEKGGLYVIARYVPHQLEKIVELAFESKELRAALSMTLSKENQDERYCLSAIACYSPSGLEDLFFLAQKDELLGKSIAGALVISDEEQWNVLHVMNSQTSPPISALLNLAEVNGQVNKALHTALGMKNKKGKTPLDHLSKDDLNYFKLSNFYSSKSLQRKSLFNPKSKKISDENKKPASKTLLKN
ncbi:hypothetical protein [Legionella gresilensis]|uniref:hypothetical protein n=1 Tax=Legionella gresilensis TaxID=91823 RepID=UPI001041BCB5|nr:hypothetical protein [Legionella gresilensis]